MARRSNDTRGAQSADRRYRAVAYTEGNTVRVERSYEVPERKRELSREDDRETQRSRQVRRNRDKALQMNPAYLIFMSLAAICVLGITVNYLKVQSSIVSTMNTIEERELELEELKADNDLMEARIRTHTDLDYIYQVATQELGMVSPSEGQVRYYEKTESEYVRQYESIP